MKTLIATFAFSAFTFGAQAQDNPFQKTSWKIETIEEDGHVVLQKTKWIDFSKGQPAYHYIQFGQLGKYNSGNNCFGEEGRYETDEDQHISFTGLDAAMSTNCEEPESLNGTYNYKLSGNRLDLYPSAVGQVSIDAVNEEPAQAAETTVETSTENDAAADVAAAAAAAEAAANNARKPAPKGKRR